MKWEGLAEAPKDHDQTWEPRSSLESTGVYKEWASAHPTSPEEPAAKGQKRSRSPVVVINDSDDGADEDFQDDAHQNDDDDFEPASSTAKPAPAAKKHKAVAPKPVAAIFLSGKETEAKKAWAAITKPVTEGSFVAWYKVTR